MPISNNLDYIKKAEEAIQQVFSNEYHNSLGIPQPKIKMLLSDHKKYNAGEYFITIGETWQIHLSFGKLPTSYKEFQEEVKVLTRHEIEHYMCCPYDVMTLDRIILGVQRVYRNEFSHLGINITELSASLANEAEDIIVDTKNFFRHPEETLRSEINWIKKGGDVTRCKGYQKLLFLTKEAIWKKNLEINETDQDILKLVNELANVFLEGGIENKQLFVKKAEEYTRVFFKLYEKERNDNSSNNKGQNGSQDGSQSNGNSTGNNQSTSGHSKPSKSRDGDQNGNAIIITDPDKVKDTLATLAQETELTEFADVLAASGIPTSKEITRIWFLMHNGPRIPIIEYDDTGNPNTYSYPAVWKIGDPVEDLDLMLTCMNSPKFIPGVTTKKWIKVTDTGKGFKKKQRDLLLVVDTSGSMGQLKIEKSRIHQAVLTAYGIIDYFESIKGKVALLGFSDRITVRKTWTTEYDEVRDALLMNGNGGTNFPMCDINNMLEKSPNSSVTVVITDGEIRNKQDTIAYFRNYILDNNKLYILLLDNEEKLGTYKQLEDIGAQIWHSNSAQGFSDFVISDMD